MPHHPRFNIRGEWPKDFNEVMLDLRNILVKCNALEDFIESLTYAINSGVQDLQDLEIVTASDYVWFMNDLLKWKPTENCPGTWVYTHIVVFYWVFNLPPLRNNRNAQTEIVPTSVGADPKPVTKWLHRYAMEIGRFMSKTESWPEGSLKTFEDAKNYHVERYKGPWTTFNEFFSRHLKVPNHIDGPSDVRVIVSPADCTYSTGMVPVEGNSEINVKGLLWNIEQLLTGSVYLKRSDFVGGKFVHAFLNTFDYHRQHAPCSGQIMEANVIAGQCYLQVVEDAPLDNKSPPRLRPVRPMPPPSDPDSDLAPTAVDGTGYQFLQCRGIFVIKNEHLGLVAVLPVGMAQVSSVRTNLMPGQIVEKGEEISWFEFGGSDIIMVFQEKANVSLTVDPTKSPHMRQGQKVIQADC